MAGIGNCEMVKLATLQGHQNAITGIALPEKSSSLYSASKDGTVRIWDCKTGECRRVITLGGEAESLISHGPWIFCAAPPKGVMAWNTETYAEFSLDGPIGHVHAMVFYNEMLMAGTDKGVILVWKAEGPFHLAASLNGHTAAVVCLLVGSVTMLYSGSIDHTIRVWDLENLQCVAKLSGHGDAVMSLVCWDHFLISCSLDCTIMVWGSTGKGNFNLEVIYTHNLEHGLVSLTGAHDSDKKPVLFCSSTDNSIFLFDLPSFSERARLCTKQEVGAIQVQAEVGGLFFSGDASGLLSVWKWMKPAVKVGDGKNILLGKRGREGTEGCGLHPIKYFAISSV